MFKYLLKWNDKLQKRAEFIGFPYQIFGIFGVITYPFYYLAWRFITPVGYESLTLRLIACILCVPLILIDKWPASLRRFSVIYWYTTITYCLPFIFTYLLLMNNISQQAVLNTFTVLVLGILLLDVEAFIVIFILGSILGWGLYWFVSGAEQHPNELVTILFTYLTLVFFGLLFSQKRQSMYYEKLQLIRSIIENAAHEFRTPLATIDICTKKISKYLPSLIKSHYYAVSTGYSESIKQNQITLLERAPDTIENEIRSALLFINTLLMNINEDNETSSFEVFSIKTTIQDAIARYPFKTNERELVHFIEQNDFTLYGTKTLLIHVIFNLLQNALYFIAAANKGEITIWLVRENHYNKLFFKDTGAGIPKKDLKKIFVPFYTSRKNYGTGVGLSFCKQVIEQFGGTIQCESVEDEYTQFVITFPLVKIEKE